MTNDITGLNPLSSTFFEGMKKGLPAYSHNDSRLPEQAKNGMITKIFFKKI